MKRFVLRLLGALVIMAVVAAASAVIPSVPTSEKEYEISDAGVSVRLQDDGSLLVHEALPFDFTGSFIGRLPRHSRPDGVQLSDFGVREAGAAATAGREHHPRLVRPPGDVRRREDGDTGTRVVWHYSAADGLGPSSSPTA